MVLAIGNVYAFCCADLRLATSENICTIYKYRSEIRRLRKDSALDIYDGCVPKFTLLERKIVDD